MTDTKCLVVWSLNAVIFLTYIVMTIAGIQTFEILKDWETLLGSLISIPVTIAAIILANKAAANAAQKQINALHHVTAQQLEEQRLQRIQIEKASREIAAIHIDTCFASFMTLAEKLLKTLTQRTANPNTKLTFTTPKDFQIFPEELINFEFIKGLSPDDSKALLEAWSSYKTVMNCKKNLDILSAEKKILREANTSNEQAFILACLHCSKMITKLATIYKNDLMKDKLIEELKSKADVAFDELVKKHPDCQVRDV